eukprot:Gregarina_sp_Poly_1__1344@NODE_1332_length_4355_cov_250_381530_g896_i0_p3_GENE_NODE_1332_length_4355_cov_250_381530_g896_i0NODE_1332_length_4355_cov_250_381530_g896_i0_p3_ORF_typecomplete_len106_score0_31ISP3_C/PF18045_1/8_8e08ISP1_C/PF18161_1/1_7e06_NODE_1332_length_4355_cov_250_381530_g896_i027953112
MFPHLINSTPNVFATLVTGPHKADVTGRASCSDSRKKRPWQGGNESEHRGRSNVSLVVSTIYLVHRCVALHLASNTCIPICMETVDDRRCFVEFMRHAKSQQQVL